MTAHPQAALFRALADHLDQNPTLPRVNARDGVDWPALQVSSYREGEIDSTPAVLLWANTLADPVGALRPHGDPEDHKVNIRVTGRISDVTVAFWDVDEGDLYRMYDADQVDDWGYSPISLDTLARYVATGTVDGVTP